MILLTSEKKEFPISEMESLHNQLNDYYNNNIYVYQNDSKEYQDILSRFSTLLDNLYQVIKDMERYNNNNNLFYQKK